MKISNVLAMAGWGWMATMLSVWPLSMTALAVPGDEHWDAQFGWPGPGGAYNYAVTTHNGRIYVSGLGSTSTNVSLEVWDGAQWSAMSQFYGSGETAVFDLAFVGDTLYAAGIFTNVDGVAANGLAKWDGQSWTSVGFNGAAYSLAADGGNLYVGGHFTNAGTVAMMNIGRWDGSVWSALGSGVGNTNNGFVYSVAASNGIVYVGGYFTNSGASSISSNVACWNGAAWTALGTGLGGNVYTLALNGSDVDAGGLFGSSGVAQWDGIGWSNLGSGFNGGVQSIAILNNLVCAAGAFTNIGGVGASHFAVWNGSSWAAAGAGLSAAGLRIAGTGTNLYVGGNFLLAGGINANGLGAWDGTNWSSVGTPGRMNGVSFLARAIAGSGTNLYAGGPFTAAGQAMVNSIARFDGQNWHSLGSGLSGSSTPNVTTPAINAIAVSGNNVYVGGSFTSAGGVGVQNMARWDGTNWYAMGDPGGLVYSVTVRTNGVYVAGSAEGLSGYADPFFVWWDGTNWQDALNFNSTNTFFQTYLNDSLPGMDAAAFQGSNIYVGGHFNIAWHDPMFNGTNCPNILRFDGTYANIVGTGLSSNVVAMAVIGTNLYVSGPFTSAGGVTVSRIARWDGNSWFDVGGGVVGSGTVSTLAAMGNYLYAGGTFTNMGGVPANRIAKWDGTNWSALGNGTHYSQTSGSVSAIAASGSDLYVGGTFRTAGDKASYYIGHWNDQLDFDVPRLINPAWQTNHQFQARLLGISGLTNVVEASSDLMNWTPILTNSAGIYDFTDPSAPNYPWRFYRGVLGP